MARYGMEFGFRDNPDTLRRGRIGRGYMGGSTHRYGQEMYHGRGGGGPQNEPGFRRGYGGDYGGRNDRQPGWGRFSGVESNRYRGVYGSDFQGTQRSWGDEHGGYRGSGRNRGGGMNPGRRGGW